MARDPLAYFVIPDPTLRGSANLLSATSQGGGAIGNVSPRAGNLGRLLPTQVGRATSSAVDLRYRLQTGGGLDTAEWTWRRASASGSSFYGKDDPRRIWGYHSVLNIGTPGSAGNAAVYSSAFRTLVVLGIDGATDTVYIARRNVDTDDHDEWMGTTFVLPVGQLRQGVTAYTGGVVAACELDDGSLLMALAVQERVFSTTFPQNPDIDIYRSVDGGATWTLQVEQILHTFTDIDGSGWIFGTTAMRMDRSGDWIRLCFVRTGGVVTTLVSSDRGSTWKRLSDSSAVGSNGRATDTYPYDIVGLNDTAGSFLFVKLSSTFATQFTHSTASADEDWFIVTLGTFSVTSAGPASIACALDGDEVVELIYKSGAGLNDQWTMLRGPRTETPLTTSGLWIQIDPVSGFEGCRHEPARMDLVQAGDALFGYFALIDNETGGTEEANAMGAYLGGWTQRSYGLRGPGQDLRIAPLHTRQWDVICGAPAPVGQPNVPTATLWTRTLVGGATQGWNEDRLQITGAAAGDALYYTRSIVPVTRWAQATPNNAGACFIWVVSIDSGDSTIASDDVAVRIRSSNGIANYDLSVRMASTTVRLRDNQAAVNYDLTGVLAVDTGENGPFTEFRLWLRSVGAGGPHAQVMCKRADEDTWHVGADVTLGGVVGVGNDIADWGQLGQAQATQMRSYWRDFDIDELHTGNQESFVNPDDLFGEATSTQRRYVENGIEAVWGGANGSRRDEFDGLIAFAHGIDALIADSPRLDWRSTSIAAQTLIFDADPDNGIERWQHDAIALFGCVDRSVIVDYDDDPAFGTATGGATLNFTRFTPLTVASTVGATLSFTGTPAPIVGEGVGLFVRVLNGAAAGRTWLVTRHVIAGTLHCGDETVALSVQGLVAGNSIALFGSSMAQPYPLGVIVRRYMRLRFSDTDTAPGDHRLGAIVPGTRHDITVPLDWAVTDNQQPNVSRFRSKSAISWAFEEGPPQRTITGRIVGDVERFREVLRGLLRQVGYEVKPVALVRDDANALQAVLGRVTSGGQLDDAAWYEDADGIMRTAGDLSLVFVEEV